MQFKLRTSVKTANIIKELQAKTSITPNVLARLAIGLSLKDPEQINPNPLENPIGIEFNRHTLTGSHDIIYKILISQHANRYLTDEEYFPVYFNQHLERGMPKLKNEFDYAGNTEKFLNSLSNPTN